MKGLVAISGTPVGGMGCPCQQVSGLGQTPTESRTPIYVLLGVLGLAVGFAFLTERRR